MPRKRKLPHHYIRPDVLDAIAAIQNHDRRAMALCAANVVGDTDRCRALLASCTEADPFFQDVLRARLAHRIYPFPPRGKFYPRKPYSAPNRLPPLFQELETPLVPPAVVVPDDSDVAEVMLPAEQEARFGGGLAEATLMKATLLPGYRSLPPDEFAAILSLVEGLDDDERADVLTAYDALPTDLGIKAVRSLFSEFGIEVPDVEREEPLFDRNRRPRKRSTRRRSAPTSLFELFGIESKK